MAAKWREILACHKDAPICSKRSATDEINWAKLTSHHITFADTALGRYEQTTKRQVKNVVTKVLRGERRELIKKLDEMEEEEDSPLISVMPNLAC